MLENTEFFALLLAILGGYVSIFGMLWDIRKKCCDNSENIAKTNARIDIEFAKCQYHRCKETNND